MNSTVLVRLGKTFFGISLILCALTGLASAQTVNAVALKAFQASSAGADAVWKSGPNNSWEATWMKEGQKMVYCYDNAGLLQQKKIVSSISSFPAGVNASVVAAYPNSNVEYAYKVVDRTNQKFFEVQVANATTVDRLRFNLEGKPVGKTSMAAAQPVAAPASPAVVAVNPVVAPTPAAAKPVIVSPAPAPAKPVVVSPTPAKPVAVSPAPVKPAAVSPTPAKPVAASPSPAKPVAASPSTAKPVAQPIAMRGESATTTKPAVSNSDLEDDDMGDLLEEDDDLGDLLEDDEDWDDIELEDDLDDDSDLLEETDEDLEIDDDMEGDDGF